MSLQALLIGAVTYTPAILLILRRWHVGLFLLVVYIPISGIAIVQSNYNPAAVLFKDFAFIAPMYLGFFWFIRERTSFKGIPRLFAVFLGLQVVLILAQMLNPHVPKFMVALIGAKVWLYYIPLMFISYNFVSSRERLTMLMRSAVVMSWIPACVGIAEFVFAKTVGYRTLMRMIYGGAASFATQGFVTFNFGVQLYRLPSTFSFAAQYSTYLWAAILTAHILSFSDTSQKWRTFGHCSTILLVIAAFLSGARGAFFFIPLLLTITYVCQFGFRGLLRGLLQLAVLLVPLAYFSGLNLYKIFTNVHQLLGHYGEHLVVGELQRAFALAPMGLGTGMNTIAARYAFSATSGLPLVGLETYYGKAVVELGVLGLVFLVLWQLVVICETIIVNKRLQSKELRAITSASVALFIAMFISNFKSFRLDWDPLNMYYWIFLGIVWRLRSLTLETTTQSENESLVVYDETEQDRQAHG